WSIDEEYCGLLGLGSKISEAPFEEDDYNLLSNLTNILISNLAHALFTKNIQQLNAELQQKNISLKEALELAHQTREDLDRRVYHLKSLYELTAELSPIAESQALLVAFLLNVLGTFGVNQGFALVYERSAQTVKGVVRGTGQQLHIDAKEADQLFYKCLASAAKRSMEPMTVTRLQDPGSLFDELGLGINVQTAAMFVVDRSVLGLVVLGPTLADLSLSEEEEQLLFAQAASFMIFFRNVRAFETIQCLNQDLTQANQELKQTISDLTEARHTIKMLEKAKTALKGVLQRQAERIGRASALDVSLILFAALVLAFAFNYANPHGIPVFPKPVLQTPIAEIDPTTARTMQQAGEAVIVDARPPEFYSQKHIVDSVNVPAALFDIIYKMKLSRLLNSETVVIVYGRNISRHYDELVAQLLLSREHGQVRILSGGLGAWEQQGYPAAQ
ncbi:MAG: rhodanese-like domain-containing protein, partial [Desulforhabdus sp.]|nr:rhodanese-like domain-containing protein [Desulforhabdus sp.]